MSFSSDHARFFVRQILANVARWATTRVGRMSSGDLGDSPKFDADLRCSQPFLEFTNAGCDGGRYLSRSTYLQTEHALVEELLTACQVENPSATADKVLTEFGSIPKFFDASRRRLDGLGIECAKLHWQIEIILKSMDFYLRPKAFDPQKINSFEKLKTYLIFEHGHLSTEHVRILYFDCQHNLIEDQFVSEGTVDACAIFPRTVVHKALDVGASGLVIVHNHPSGDPSPSRQDMKITNDICFACKQLNIAVFDHIIIAKDRHFSFMTNKLM